jgi:hypothetical protein
VRVEQQILEFQVSMHNLFGVEVLDASKKLGKEVSGFRLLEILSSEDVFKELSSFELITF